MNLFLFVLVCAFYVAFSWALDIYGIIMLFLENFSLHDIILSKLKTCSFQIDFLIINFVLLSSSKTLFLLLLVVSLIFGKIYV